MRMKGGCIITAFLAILALSGQAWGDASAGAYNQGNAKFAQGDYAGALDLYDSVNIQNPDLEYNRGAAHLKLGALGKAALHFMRALRLKPGDEDAAANLKYIASRKVDREPSMDKGYAVKAAEWILSLGAVQQTINAALGLYMASTLLAVALILAQPGKWRARAGLALAVLLSFTLASGALALYRIDLLQDRSMAVVMAQEAPVYPEPSAASAPVFTLHEATIVRQGRVEGNYLFVTLPSGHSGWMDRSALERI